MTPRQIWLFSLSVAVVVAVDGCKNSPKSVAATATPRAATSPVAATLPVQAKPATRMPIASKREPDLEHGIPAKTFQVQPPASFTSDQVPENSIVEFRFTAKAGQVLHVRMHEDEWYPGLLVQKPGVSPGEFAYGGDSEGNRLYTLPETGDYRVVGQHTANQQTDGKNVAIQFALLNIDDPLVDPGIRPDQISLDGGDLTANGKWSLIPYSHFEGYVDDPWPSHLALKGTHVEFRIMPIAGYKKIVSGEDMDSLQAAIRESGKGSDARKFPYTYYGDASLDIASKPKFLQGDGWRGFRWFGQYMQDTGCGLDDLVYIFEAISDDGKLFARMQTPISNPEVTRHLDKQCMDRTRDRDFDAFFKTEMPVMFDKELSTAAPASFQPNLDQLDAVVRSLKLKQ